MGEAEERRMGQTPNERLHDLVERLARDPAMPQQLPGEDGAYVRAALAGQSVHVIAQQHHVSEEAVWRALSNAARLAAGEPAARPVETGGLGSDTDPGITGGYGDTTEDRAEMIAQGIRAATRSIGRHGSVVVIGDTVHDITAAKANNAVAIGVLTGNVDEKTLSDAGADMVLPTLEDAYSRLGR